MIRKKNWIGHLLRRGKNVLEGRNRPRGRKRIGMFDDIEEGWYVDIKKRAQNYREELGLDAKDLPFGRTLMMMSLSLRYRKKTDRTWQTQRS